MSLQISNVSALIAENALNNTQSMMNQTMQQLSTGSTINTGADNPSGLVISEQQLNQIAGLQTAISNTSQAVSMVQTADGALGTINDLLTQVRSLAVSAANTGANSTDALAADQAQISQALNTINSIAANTTFNNKYILNGDTSIGGFTNSSDISFTGATSSSPVVTNSAVNITAAGTRAVVDATDIQTGALAANETLDINGVNIQLTAGEKQADVINTINSYSTQTGVVAQVAGANATNPGATELYSTKFGTAGTISVQSNVAAGATSSGFGTSVGTAAGTNITGTIGGAAATGVGNVLTGTATGNEGISVTAAVDPTTSNLSTVAGAVGTVSTTNNPLTFQIGANYGQTASVSVSNVSATNLATNVTNTSGFTSLNSINVTTQQGAEDSINLIDAATTQISDLRAQLGAVQQYNLTENQSNLQSTLQNTQSANSVVQGTDYAAATAAYAQDQVLMQIGTSVLQNTSQTSQLVLSLVKNM
jgi:flagellin